MIELLKLRFNNIGRFITEQEINFSSHSKLMQIDGENQNSGGSSGSGKTTIFLALDYLLGVNDSPTTVLQSRLTKQPLTVTGEFLINKDLITITRSPKGGLTIVTPTETISGNVALAQEKLTQLLGIPQKLIKKLFHKRQGEGGFFLNLTSKETYEFLSKVLNLDSYNDKIQKIQAKSKLSESLIVGSTVNLKYANEQLQLFAQYRQELVAPELPDLKEKQSLEQAILLDQQVLNKLRLGLQTELSATQMPNKEEFKLDDSGLKLLISKLSDLKKDKQIQLSEYSQKLQGLNDTLKKLEVQIFSLKTAEKSLNHNSRLLDHNKSELESLHSHHCPTCNQIWIGEDVSKKIKDLQVRQQELLESISQSQADLAKKESVEASRIRLQSIIDNFKADTSAIDKQIEEITNQKFAEEQRLNNEKLEIENRNKFAILSYNNQITSIKQAYSDKINNIERKINQQQGQLDLMKQAEDNYKSQLKKYQSDCKRFDEEISKATLSMADIQSQKMEAERQIAIADEAIRLIKSYILKMFQTTLNTIGETASDFLSGVTALSTTSIYFEDCKETKSGAVKDEVSAILSSDGVEGIPIKSLSGGERNVVDLAVDLAVIDTIEQIAGVGFDFWIADEVFDGLDSIGKEQCLELLNNMDINKRIILVDHSNEVKELASDVIKVVRNKETSCIAE